MSTIADIVIVAIALATPLLAIAWAATYIVDKDDGRMEDARRRIGLAAAGAATLYGAIAITLLAGRELSAIVAALM